MQKSRTRVNQRQCADVSATGVEHCTFARMPSYRRDDMPTFESVGYRNKHRVTAEPTAAGFDFTCSCGRTETVTNTQRHDYGFSWLTWSENFLAHADDEAVNAA